MKLNLFTEKLRKLAFGRFEKLHQLGEKLFAVIKKSQDTVHQSRLKTLLEWYTVPLTLWRVDVGGFGQYLARELEAGVAVDPRYLVLLDKLTELPSPEEQEHVARLEFKVQSGNYGSLLTSSAKYDTLEKERQEDPELQREWAEIKELFDITKYQYNGIVHRTRMQERNMRPKEWYFKGQWDKERWLFQAFFDSFALKFNLYGMRGDTPLLARFTVNRTAFSTEISIPRYLYPDPRRDLNWTEIREIIWNPDLVWQGAKACQNRLERIEFLRRIAAANAEAQSKGLKGKKRWAYIKAKAGLRYDVDARTFRRWIKEAQEFTEPAPTVEEQLKPEEVCV